MPFVKIHKRGAQHVLAACDEELLGERLHSGEVEVRVSEPFYGGEKRSIGELGKMLEEHDNINLIGGECVQVALQKGLITKSSVIQIGTVPHVQIFCI